MIESARRSIGDFYGLKYEFVIVDGNSGDGTQEWCHQQADVRLIQHSRLLGAVKAFNDGAIAAHGEYVILGNDDIEFLDDTILRGYIHMQENPDCGIGCFYQNRNGRDWHVESMPVVRNDKQASEPYGQVCIIPRWLGNYVGWWGDYLHTYGGDNEISSKVYELGFKVTPVEGTKIHDNEANDDLRKINNIRGAKDPRAVRGHHPDSWAWGRRWRDNAKNLVGAIIKDSPIMENQTKKRERILYLPVFEQGWPILKEQKRGLREALARTGLVSEFDYLEKNAQIGKVGMIAELQQVCQQIFPTLVLTQIHNGDIINADDITMLRNIAPLAKFVNWNGDFWPDNLLSREGLRLSRSFDLQTIVNREVLEKYREMGIQAEYWQIGWEPDGIDHGPDQFHDLVFLASGYSPARQNLGRQLRSLNGINFGLFGKGWPGGWTKGENLYNFREACKVYRGAKISLGDSQWPESGFVSNRVMQALAAGGSALAHQWFRGMEDLGLVDGETVIVWQDFPDLERKLRYYLGHEEERGRIASAGERLAREEHSFEARVKEIFAMIGLYENRITEDWRW